MTELDIRAAPGLQPPELRNVAAELAFCQRYYYRIAAPIGTPICTGFGKISGGCCSNPFFIDWAGYLGFPVPMRTPPTGVTFSGTNHFTLDTPTFSSPASVYGARLVSNFTLPNAPSINIFVLSSTSSSGAVSVSVEL